LSHFKNVTSANNVFDLQVDYIDLQNSHTTLATTLTRSRLWCGYMASLYPLHVERRL